MSQTMFKLVTKVVCLSVVFTSCFGCSPSSDSDATGGANQANETQVTSTASSGEGNPQAGDDVGEQDEMNLETITLGAGCFWCIEAVLQKVKGIESVVSGYMGGDVINPTYEQICTGNTGHAEVVEVKFDPDAISLDELLDLFWQLHDPTTLNRQGPDRGTQYRSAIFYHSDEQRTTAEASKKQWNDSGKFQDPIVTEITQAVTFYEAEEYHQDYFAKNPNNPYCQFNIPPKLKKLGL